MIRQTSFRAIPSALTSCSRLAVPRPVVRPLLRPWSTCSFSCASFTRSTPPPSFSSTSFPSTVNMVLPDYQAILQGKYPAKTHLRNVVGEIRKSDPSVDSALLYVEGTCVQLVEDDDTEVHFRQRRCFYYVTGCEVPGSQLVYDVAADKATLFIPPVDPEEVIWSGLPLTVPEAKRIYDVDDVKTTDQVLDSLSAAKSVFAVEKQIMDKVRARLNPDQINTVALKAAMERVRVVKDEYEIALMQKAGAITADAHHILMKRAARARNEGELYGAFLEACVSRGAPNQAYHPIIATGRGPATLHYHDNNQPTEGKLNVLVDAGAEYSCYAADITRTYPLSGTFSTESRAIYDIVLRMQKECIEKLRGDVVWDDVHVHAHRVLIDGLLKLGVLRGDAEAILAARTSVAFMPHGLGHYLGLDVHDKGGKPNYQDTDSLFRYLRIRGAVPAGAVVTVEPGPYLDDPKHAQYIHLPTLGKYWDVGGVRIEDNLLVTENGSELLSTIAKEPSEMEALIQSSSEN